MCFCTMRWWVAVEAIEDLLADIIALGRQSVTEVECSFSEDRSVSVSLRKKEVATATESVSSVLSVRTISDGRIGVSTTNDPMRWKECLFAAIKSGRTATPQLWEGLPGPAVVDTTIASYDSAVDPGPQAAYLLLSGLLEGASAHPVDISSGGADLSVGTAWLANSSGASYKRRESGVSCSLETISGQSTGSEFEQSFSAGIDPVKVGKQAAFLAAHSVDAGEVSTGSYDVVLSPIAFAQLLSYVVIPALSGRNVHAGRSKLADKTGLGVMDPALQIFDDPFAPRGLGRTPWDAEGVPARRIEFVRDGVLQEFAYDLKTAYRYDKQSTASAVRNGYGGAPSIGFHNLILDGVRERIDDDRCIYIHDVVGAHTANPASGDFSVEISNPIWMENGEYGRPIRKAMLAGNVFSLLTALSGIGEGSRVVGSSIMPPVRLHNQRIIGG